MWSPISGSMAGLQPPIFGNSRVTLSIKSVWRLEDLVKALDMFKVPAQEKGELLGLLGLMKKDNVEAP
jgi:hypothetical protein